MIRIFLVDEDIIQLHSNGYCEFRVSTNKLRAQANSEFIELLMCYKRKSGAAKFDNERMKFVMIKL